MHKAADPRDLRCILATLTDRGRLLVEIASPECDAVHVAIHKAMGTDKMLKLADLLTELESKVVPLEIGALQPQAINAEARPLAPAKQRGRPRKIAV